MHAIDLSSCASYHSITRHGQSDIALLHLPVPAFLFSCCSAAWRHHAHVPGVSSDRVLLHHDAFLPAHGTCRSPLCHQLHPLGPSCCSWLWPADRLGLNSRPPLRDDVSMSIAPHRLCCACCCKHLDLILTHCSLSCAGSESNSRLISVPHVTCSLLLSQAIGTEQPDAVT